MKPFQAKYFTVLQSKNVFKVGTDGVLLGLLCNVDFAESILEIGPGTGIISLLCAQRSSNATIFAIEIDENASAVATENFKNSIFSDRLRCLQDDFKEFSTDEKFNLIVCNPPYFKPNDSEKLTQARQTLTLDAESLLKKGSEMLSPGGRISLILPAPQKELYLAFAEKFSLFPERFVNIYGIKNGPVRRVILEFSSIKKEISEEVFVIESAPRVYSKQYLDLSKDFHIFHK